MTITQPRTPAGSPDGGQFADGAGAEAGAMLRPAAEPIPVVLCSDCHFEQANENPDLQYTDNSSCESCFDDGVDCDHEGFSQDEFSGSPCAVCDTTYAGHRHHYAYWPSDEETAEQAQWEERNRAEVTAMRQEQSDHSRDVTGRMISRVHRGELTGRDAVLARVLAHHSTTEVLFADTEPTPDQLGTALATINDDVPLTQAVTARWNGCNSDIVEGFFQHNTERINALSTVKADGVPAARAGTPDGVRVTAAQAGLARRRLRTLIDMASKPADTAGPRYLLAALARIEGTEPAGVKALAAEATKANNQYTLAHLLWMDADA